MLAIKLLTLNTHSLVENDNAKKLECFVNAVEQELPDVIALQEVNQTRDEEILSIDTLTDYIPCQPDVKIKKDNFAYNVVRMLRIKDILYYWSYLPMKLGYDKFDEGIAILSRKPIVRTDTFLISKINDYYNWKTRKVLGIQTEDNNWFYTAHLGWWNDTDEPFEQQWQKLNEYVKSPQTVWLMGDFNSPADVRCEGYDLISASGWYDSYILAKEKDNGYTVGKIIDGWKEKISQTTGMRIDHIWCNKKLNIKNSQVIFNDKNFDIISDHYGVMICVEEE